MNIKNTVNKEEIDKFSKLADEWWDPSGKFAPLHKFNPIRQEYIINEISKNFVINIDNPNSLEKLKILDVGCGGGLLCEPLARLGAKVTGIDASAPIFPKPKTADPSLMIATVFFFNVKS